ncbi:MAG: hypothetical protein AMXMBFR36_18330 [Acidobacteriota bacterium]
MSDERWQARPTDESPSAEQIAALVAGAGPRPEPPEADLLRIREAARAEWRRRYAEVGARPSPTVGWLALAASVLLAVTLIWLATRRSPAPVSELVAEVEVVHGTVRPAGLEAGGALVAGSRLETGAGTEAGAVGLRLAGGARLRLDAGTSLGLDSARSVRLDRGAVYVDSDGVPGGGVVVETALGTVREIGTRFEVRLAPLAGGLIVGVRDGRVAIERGGSSREVGAGERLELAADGTVTLRALAADDPDWSWISAASGLDIEGRTLGELLARYTAATGRPARFADAELEAEAAGVVLHGSVSGLGPDEILEAAVAGAGLRLGRDGAARVVERPEAEGRVRTRR